MTRNSGQSHLKRRRRNDPPMRAYDRLPVHLRRWLADAMLPWSAQSVQRAFSKALAQTGDPEQALAELDRLEARRVAQDARKIWGATHPFLNDERPAPR